MSEERLRATEEQAAHEGNYEFMLHGRQDIAALAEEVRRLRAANEGLAAAIARWESAPVASYREAECMYCGGSGKRSEWRGIPKEAEEQR